MSNKKNQLPYKLEMINKKFARRISNPEYQCQCENLVKLSSMNKKICPDCGKEYEWSLEPDQKPLLGCNRSTRYIAPRKATRVEINKEALVVSAFFDEERMDIIGQNGNDGEVYMCGNHWLETGSPWKE